jgi:hypothetical protein
VLDSHAPYLVRNGSYTAVVTFQCAFHVSGARNTGAGSSAVAQNKRLNEIIREVDDEKGGVVGGAGNHT